MNRKPEDQSKTYDRIYIHLSGTPSLTTGTKPPICHIPQQPSIYVTSFSVFYTEVNSELFNWSSSKIWSYGLVIWS